MPIISIIVEALDILCKIILVLFPKGVTGFE